jgi:hypothetical protein
VRLGFLLAHHDPAEYDRCYRLGGVRLCARCCGLYPALALVLALELAGGFTALRLEWAILYGLPLPALCTWARRRLAGVAGSNPVATVTGALLGVALGRGLFLYFRDPASPRFWIQALGLGLCVLVVEILARLRRRR